MRLEKLKVNGFGRLHGLRVDLEGPVTVLYGPNEAGKSTLLGFVRAMLFGIPSRTYGAERYEPARGGAHGGTLEIVGDDGVRWLIERHAQPPEGGAPPGGRGERTRITRTGPDGQLRECTQEELQRELLGGMSKGTFRQLFAVTLTELQEVSALQSEEMSRFLFHAGIGGGAAVLRGEKKLVQEMDKLYRPRGRNQEMAQILLAAERLERQAGEAKSLLPRYHEVMKELAETEALMEAGEKELELLAKDAAKLNKAAACRTEWLQREALHTELAGIPERKPFPEQGLARWEALREEKERLRLEAGELGRKISALRDERDAIHPNRTLLEREAELRSLAERLAGYESRIRELTDLDTEVARLEEKLAQCLGSIHPDWTVEQLRGFAGTVGERETVRQFATRFQAYEKEMDRLQHERFKLERETEALKASYTQAAKRLEESLAAGYRQFAELVPADRDEIRSLWNEISALLDRWRAAASSHAENRRAADAEAAAAGRVRQIYKQLLVGTSAMTVLLPLMLWLATKSWMSTSLGGVVLLGLDVYLFVRLSLGTGRNKPGNRKRSRRLATGAGFPDSDASPEASKLSELMPRLIRHPLSASGSESGARLTFDPQQWDEEERSLRRRMEGWMLWDQRHEALEAQTGEARFKAEGKAAELGGLEREMARKEGSFGELAREWEWWLHERHLPDDLSPEAAMDVFRLAEQGKDWLGQLDALSAKATAARKEADAFEAACLEQLRPILGGETAPETENAKSQSVSAGLRRALAELGEQLEMRNRLDRIADQQAPLKEALDRVRDRLEAIESSERHLLAESGAEDGEHYLRIGAETARKEALLSELRQTELVLFASLDDRQRRELELLLQSHGEEELARMAEAARVRLEAAEQHQMQLQERRGRLLQEQESLESRGLRENWQQQLAEQQSLLSDVLDRYAVMAVSHELIRRVRKIYEEERQPQVLKRASDYLEEMTGGVYRKILMKMGTQELMAEHAELGPVGSDNLSRGTAEQLYLSMRLALSEAVSGKEKLPLLLDDLFVNFDAKRLSGALSVLKKVSARHQLIMMTCHAHVQEEIRRQFPEAQVIRMEPVITS